MKPGQSLPSTQGKTQTGADGLQTYGATQPIAPRQGTHRLVVGSQAGLAPLQWASLAHSAQTPLASQISGAGQPWVGLHG